MPSGCRACVQIEVNFTSKFPAPPTSTRWLFGHVKILVSNYRVITGKYRRILRFLVFLLRYGLYRGKDGITVRRLENSG